MDPHSTTKKVRNCQECHQNPKTLGLGYGNIVYKDNEWHFQPSTASKKSVFGSERLDAFVDINGRALVHTSRVGLRPFNKKELDRILWVGFCLGCHSGDDSKVFGDWRPGIKKSPCSYAME